MINYLKGDATQPIGTGRKTIAHIVNDAGYWGAGFTKALTERWPQTELKYYKWFQEQVSGAKPELGDTYVYSLKHLDYAIDPDVLVSPIDDPEALFLFNMCAQHGVGRATKPIRYKALEECLEHLGEFCRSQKTSLHGPRFGSGLAGGNWGKIEPMIERHTRGVEVFIYDL